VANIAISTISKHNPDTRGTGLGLLTYPDVLVRLAGLLAIVAVEAAVGWQVAPNLPASPIVWLVAVLALVGIAIVTARALAQDNLTVGVPLALGYAAGQGALIGWISRGYDAAFGGGIVPQAVLATTVTFVIMVLFSATNTGKRSGRAVRVFTTAALGYLVFSLVNVVAAIMGVGDGWGFAGLGVFGMLVCLIGVLMAAWSVNVDVVAVMDRVDRPASPGMAWALAFALTVSVLWLYLEILRLLGRSRDPQEMETYRAGP